MDYNSYNYGRCEKLATAFTNGTWRLKHRARESAPHLWLQSRVYASSITERIQIDPGSVRVHKSPAGDEPSVQIAYRSNEKYALPVASRDEVIIKRRRSMYFQKNYIYDNALVGIW